MDVATSTAFQDTNSLSGVFPMYVSPRSGASCFKALNCFFIFCAQNKNFTKGLFDMYEMFTVACHSGLFVDATEFFLYFFCSCCHEWSSSSAAVNFAGFFGALSTLAVSGKARLKRTPRVRPARTIMASGPSIEPHLPRRHLPGNVRTYSKAPGTLSATRRSFAPAPVDRHTFTTVATLEKYLWPESFLLHSHASKVASMFLTVLWAGCKKHHDTQMAMFWANARKKKLERVEKPWLSEPLSKLNPKKVSRCGCDGDYRARLAIVGYPQPDICVSTRLQISRPPLP